MSNVDKVKIHGQYYYILSPSIVGNYVETIGEGCKNPDGYVQGKVFLGMVDDVMYLFKASQAIVYEETITENYNCGRRTLDDIGGSATTPDISMDATVDATVGTPAVVVTESGTVEFPHFTLAFTGLKGETGAQGPQGAQGETGAQGPQGIQGETGATGAQGPQGETGPTGATGATPDITMTASVDGTIGTPAVVVTEGGTTENPTFDLAFSGLKGETGQTGATGAQGATGATGNGIVTITLTSGTHAAGTLDTYTITFTDGTTTTFQVYNGADGQGAGDMTKAVYDSDSSVESAGGIAAYVENQIKTLDVADTAVSGSYVTAVSETDGKISVTREAADNTPTASSKKVVTSGGVKAYVDTNTISGVSGASGNSDGQVKLSVTKNGSTTNSNVNVTGWSKLAGQWTSAVSCAVGATSASFSNPYSTTSVAVDAFIQNSSGTPVGYNTMTTTASTITLAFDALEEAASIRLLVRNLT